MSEPPLLQALSQATDVVADPPLGESQSASAVPNAFPPWIVLRTAWASGPEVADYVKDVQDTWSGAATP